MSCYCKGCDRERKRRSSQKIKGQDPQRWKDRSKHYKETYQKKHPQRVKKSQKRQDVRRRFGISIEEFEKLMNESVCAICGTAGNLVLDHEHVSSKIRDVLCSTCNIGLGMFKENPQWLREAAKYLEKHR